MKHGLLTLALRWLTIVALRIEVQPSGAQTWIQWSSAAGGNNHYYALTPFATNWAAAQHLAVSWGGTLATITSSNEQNFINTNFLAGAFEHLPLWIGLVDPATKGTISGTLRQVEMRMGFNPQGTFKWVTGETLSYSNWKSGEPNGVSGGENYGTINWEYSDDPPRGIKGDWNDTPLNGTSGYGGKTDGPYFGLVERDPNSFHTSKRGPWQYALRLGLIALLVAALIIWFTRSRRHRSSAS
jgi:hypothetical protein